MGMTASVRVTVRVTAIVTVTYIGHRVPVVIWIAETSVAVPHLREVALKSHYV